MKKRTQLLERETRIEDIPTAVQERLRSILRAIKTNLGSKTTAIDFLAKESIDNNDYPIIAYLKSITGFTNRFGTDGTAVITPADPTSMPNIQVEFEDVITHVFDQAGSAPNEHSFYDLLGRTQDPEGSLLWFFMNSQHSTRLADKKLKMADMLELYITLLFGYWGVSDSWHKDGPGQDVVLNGKYIVEGKYKDSPAQYNIALNKTPPGISNPYKCYCFMRKSGNGIQFTFVEAILYFLFASISDPEAVKIQGVPALLNDDVFKSAFRLTMSTDDADGPSEQDIISLSKVFDQKLTEMSEQLPAVLRSAFLKIYSGDVIGTPVYNKGGQIQSYDFTAAQNNALQRITKGEYERGYSDLKVSFGNFQVSWRPDFKMLGGYTGIATAPSLSDPLSRPGIGGGPLPPITERQTEISVKDSDIREIIAELLLAKYG